MTYLDVDGPFAVAAREVIDAHYRVRGTVYSGQCACGFAWDDENGEGYFSGHVAEQVIALLEVVEVRRVGIASDGVPFTTAHTPEMHAELLDLATPEEHEYLTDGGWYPVFRLRPEPR